MAAELAGLLRTALADAVRLGSITPEQVEQLIAPLEGVPGGQMPMPAAAPQPASSEGDLLTVVEAAALLRVTRRWLYRHAATLPFTRKLSRKTLRFSRAGLARWLATRRYHPGAAPR